jgi:putative cell wall-binding protein
MTVPVRLALALPSRATHLLLAIALALGVVAVPSVSPAAAAGLTVVRYGGADRYATAAAVSAAHYAPGVPVAYVATGTNFPDALAGGPLAARGGGPLVLVGATSIPPATAAELTRLRPARIVILGGEGAVSSRVADSLVAYQTGGGVERVAGSDRYATAAGISRLVAPGSGVPVAYVATGENFPDALVGGVAAARRGAPLLLARRTSLPGPTDAELQRLAPREIIVLGGAGVVDDTVVGRLRQLATSGTVRRLAGADRYSTGVAVSAASFGSPTGSLFIASGKSFADALVSVPAAAKTGGALLLVPGSSVPSAVQTEAKRLAPTRLVLMGGMAAVNERVTFDLRVALGDLAPLPACAYRDVLTPYRAYDDWRRTLVDTILMVPSTYHPGDLVDTSTAGMNGGYAVRSLVVSDLRALGDAARAAGRPVQVISGFRSYAAQEQTFNYWVSVGGYEQALRTSARAGHSEHQLGTTLDFKSSGGPAPWDIADWATTPAGRWMAENAWRYGFVMSYPRSSFDRVCYDYESWHYRYYGRDVAARIRASGLTPREWLWMTGSGG